MGRNGSSPGRRRRKSFSSGDSSCGCLFTRNVVDIVSPNSRFGTNRSGDTKLLSFFLLAFPPKGLLAGLRPRSGDATSVVLFSFKRGAEELALGLRKSDMLEALGDARGGKLIDGNVSG